MLERLVPVFATCGFLSLTEAHVSLNYPVARSLNLDFFDTFRYVRDNQSQITIPALNTFSNYRTETPCGMSKGSVKTTVQAGADLKVDWHLGYPHGGMC